MVESFYAVFSSSLDTPSSQFIEELQVANMVWSVPGVRPLASHFGWNFRPIFGEFLILVFRRFRAWPTPTSPRPAYV